MIHVFKNHSSSEVRSWETSMCKATLRTVARQDMARDRAHEVTEVRHRQHGYTIVVIQCAS